MTNGNGMTFVVSEKEIKKAVRWRKKHDKEAHKDEFRNGSRYTGAIGGAYTWQFTSTSIGTVVKCICACGAELDLTDYDDW